MGAIMKRLFSLLSLILCFSSLFAVVLKHKTVLDIFGDPVKEKALTLSEPLEGKYTDSLHEQEPFTWTVTIDENGYVSFDIYKNGIPFDMSQYYYLSIAFKVDESQTPIECSAYVTKSEKYYYNRVVSEKPLFQYIENASTVKIVIYNSSCVYNLGIVNVSGIGDLFYDSDSYHKTLDLIENKEYETAKAVIEAMDSKSYKYFDCKSLIDIIDTALYLDTAELKYEEEYYKEVETILDALQKENPRIYASAKAQDLKNVVEFYNALELIANESFASGLQCLYTIYQNIDNKIVICDYEDDVFVSIEKAINSETSLPKMNAIVANALSYDFNIPSYKTKILEFYANAIKNKAFASSFQYVNHQQIDSLRKTFKKEYNNLPSETIRILLDVLYVNDIEVLVDEGNFDSASALLEEYRLFDEHDETKIKTVSRKIEKYYSNNKLRINFGFEGNVCIPPLKEKIYMEGTYEDPDRLVTYKKASNATIKNMLGLHVGITVPFTKQLFGGYRTGIAGNGLAFIEEEREYSTFNGPLVSQHIEVGIYLGDSMFFTKVFAKYLISLVPNVDNSICAGVAVGIPYVEIGFVMDNMKNPAIFFSGQISFELD